MHLLPSSSPSEPLASYTSPPCPEIVCAPLHTAEFTAFQGKQGNYKECLDKVIIEAAGSGVAWWKAWGKGTR